MDKVKIRCKYDALLPIEDIVLDPDNRNIHPDDQIVQLAKILKYQGFRHPIIISERTGFVKAGEGRFLAAKEAGMKEVPVEYQLFEDSDQELAFGISDNAIASQATLDFAGIHDDLGKFDGQFFDIDMLGIKDFAVEPADKFEQPKEKDLDGEMKTTNKCPSCNYEW